MRNLQAMKADVIRRHNEVGVAAEFDFEPDIHGNVRLVLMPTGWTEDPLVLVKPPAVVRGILLRARNDAINSGDDPSNIDRLIDDLSDAIAELERRQRVERGRD